MENTTLVEVLKTFTPSEVKALNLFMASAYNNHSSRVLQLYTAVIAYYPHFSSNKLKKESVYETIFGKKSFNAALLRNLVSDTLAAVETFMAIEEFQKNELLKKRFVREAYMNRKVYAQAAHSLKESVERHSKIKQVNADYFHHDFLQLHTWFSLSFNRQYRGNLNKLYKKQGIDDLIVKLDAYYLLEYSLLVSEMVNSYRAHNKNFDAAQHINRIHHFLANGDLLHPVVKYRLEHCLMLLKSDAEAFANVRSDFERLLPQMDDALQLVSIVELYGFASLMAWKGDKYFIEQMDEMIVLREQQNLILDETGGINPIAFNNIVRIKLRKNGLKAASEFVQQYENHLPEVIKADTIKLSQASIEIHQKQYNQALDTLLTIQKPFFGSEIIYRRMLIKCYFELKDWTALSNALESTKKFIQNNSSEISGLIIQAMKRYLEMMSNLYKYMTTYKPSHKTKLEQLLLQPGFIFEEVWIREMLSKK